MKENKRNKILFAEDDTNLGSLLKEYLELQGFEPSQALNGKEALELFYRKEFDIVLLDVMMPLLDGFKVAKEIRKVNATIPIIFLTAKSLKEDILKGLRMGADDYMTKPFSMKELVMRINTVLKRAYKIQDEEEVEVQEFEIGRYSFNARKQELKIDDEVRKLTTKENELLRYLCLKKNLILDRNYALQKIWDDEGDGKGYSPQRSIDVYILKLRRLLEKDDSVKIVNIHGKGFKLLCD